MSDKERKLNLSKADSYYLDVVKKNLRFSQGTPNYVPMRIAIGRSLQTRKKPEYEEWLSKKDQEQEIRGGESPTLGTVEHGQGTLFRAILSQRAERKLSSEEYGDLLLTHMRHGLRLIAQESDRLKGYEYLMGILGYNQNKQGSTAIEAKLDAYTIPPLEVHIGLDKESKSPVTISLNTANNPHMGIMGGSGSGKTYFLKHLLTEIRQKSNFETHFIIFDYKDGDIARDEKFLDATKAEVIDVKRQPIPINIFKGVEKDEREQRARAERVVELFKSAEAKIGGVQEENLYQAILNAYASQQPYPDFGTVREALQEINDKADTITSLLRPVVDQHYFANKDEFIYDSLTNKTLVIDIHEVDRKDLIVFLVLNQIHRELKEMGTAPEDPQTGAKQLRIFIVIDEAHYFLSIPKRAKVLENMIRDVRSGGGGIILASQSPDDYEKTDFNFLELLEFALVLKSSPQSSKFFEQKFGLSGSDANSLLRKLNTFNRGEGRLNSFKGLIELTKS